ncbi:unannotated protein [freshwater metagenome]|uniref:Unannotated protein n=1 Tax=freshwater metagenome TaxID=449393 RepID=A0A6J7J200_9ZZZZ
MRSPASGMYGRHTVCACPDFAPMLRTKMPGLPARFAPMRPAVSL